jgi:ABC-type multidrug transport system fused ATPase/permease subunit
MNDSIRDIVNDWGTVMCLSELLDGKPAISHQQHQQQNITNSDQAPILPPRYSSGIALQNITFKYPGSEIPTLNKFNLHIERGEKVAIVGEIGAGKSTVLKLIMKYLTPTEGDLFLNGVNYKQIKVSEIRRTIGYIPQSPILFNRSVYENITYGLPPNSLTREQVIERLKDLNVYSEFERLQHGLDTVVGKNASKISGGQRQLIWCLRVLFTNPDYLVMDEPTASVNEEVKEKLRTIINRVMQGKTVVMVTHDKFLMSYADRIVKV